MNEFNGGRSGVSSYISHSWESLYTYIRFRVHFTHCMAQLCVDAQSLFIPGRVYAKASSRNNYPIRLTKYPKAFGFENIRFSIAGIRIQKPLIASQELNTPCGGEHFNRNIKIENILKRSLNYQDVIFSYKSAWLIIVSGFNETPRTREQITNISRVNTF